MARTAEQGSIVVAAQPSTVRATLAGIGWAPFALTGVALVALVWFGRDMTFYHDEFAFLLLRDLSINGIFSPHNEHLSATLVILYRVLFGTVGTVSYWPYLAVTFALHVSVAWIVYYVVRREASPAWALGAMAVVLMLGSGGDDILWAFQSGTIGAVAAGMAAVVVAPRRPAVAAILLTIAMLTSGGWLAFLVGTAVHLVLTRPRGLVVAGAAGRAVPRLVRPVRDIGHLAGTPRPRRVRPHRAVRERGRGDGIDGAGGR